LQCYIGESFLLTVFESVHFLAYFLCAPRNFLPSLSLFVVFRPGTPSSGVLAFPVDRNSVRSLSVDAAVNHHGRGVSWQPLGLSPETVEGCRSTFAAGWRRGRSRPCSTLSGLRLLFFSVNLTTDFEDYLRSS